MSEYSLKFYHYIHNTNKRPRKSNFTTFLVSVKTVYNLMYKNNRQGYV